ncbi:MAG TPA: hydrogenase expression/formation protein HypE [Polyangiaceae bacterium]|jgi:hydrogenase expression/formation protein HypE
MSSDDTTAIFTGACPAPIAQTPRILMGHGSGGRLTAKLIDELIVPSFRNPLLEPLDDSAILAPGARRIAFTTDSYVVTPIFFPGGDIGELAVNGTVNDLVVSGARPIALSLAFILEEGFPLQDFERVVGSVKRAAEAAGVRVATGDTKVVGKGCADKVFINTSGIGEVPDGLELSSRRVRAGDAVLLSGTIGDHGVAILSCREGLEFGGAIASDTAPLTSLVQGVLTSCRDVHAMRDPTRGGVASTLVEIASRQQLGIEIDEACVPVRDVVRGACEMLGLDPLLVANEGKVIVFLPEEQADAALAAMRGHPLGRDAARIGHVTREHAGEVLVRTPIGGTRVLQLPYSEMLPRIC